MAFCNNLTKNKKRRDAAVSSASSGLRGIFEGKWIMGQIVPVMIRVEMPGVTL